MTDTELPKLPNGWEWSEYTTAVGKFYSAKFFNLATKQMEVEVSRRGVDLTVTSEFYTAFVPLTVMRAVLEANATV